MPIRKLPTLLVNQIAAGEVIERPASVVKELVENSLDAGASRIDIAIEQGGAALIRIADDGCGITAAELPLAVEPHATSKLASAQDLEAIGTFGFRGEALASIGSVARLRLTSRATVDGKPDEAGAVIEVAGEQISEPAPAGCAPGTVVEVRDLFFNTPARRKFMRTPPTEYGHIHDAVSRIAMMHPKVAFKLTNNDRVVLDLSAAPGRAARCVAVLGKDMAEALLEFERQDTRPTDSDRAAPGVWGMAGMPSLGRANSKALYLAINGRPVKDRNLLHAVREAYRGLMPPDRFPVAVVFLTMDPRAVDVNVHPAKSEVRFREPSAVHGLVLSSMRQRLLGADLTPSAGIRDQGSGVRASRWEPPAPSSDDSDPTTDQQRPNANAFVDYFRRMDPTEKGFVYQQVKQELAKDDPEVAAEPSLSQSPSPARQPLLSERILQVRNSYVVTEDDDGIVIVDQHALHERVMFEELRRRVLGNGERLESQRLLMPEVVKASAKRQALLEDLAPLLERIGIEAEPIGPDAVGIQAFPSFLFSRKVEAGPFLDELLDKAEAGDLDTSSLKPQAEGLELEAALHDVLDMMACKAAIKAGDRLTGDELSALLAKRGEVERSGSCPHGRPTTLRLTLKDLERQFGRA